MNPASPTPDKTVPPYSLTPVRRACIAKHSLWLVPAMTVTFYGFSAYLHVATASMSDTYLPGIEPLKFIFSPGLILFLLFLVSIITRRAPVIKIYQITCVVAIILNFLLFVIIWVRGSNIVVEQPYYPEFWPMLRHSLLDPDFSNRSYLKVFWGFSLAFGHALIAGFLGRYVRHPLPRRI